MYVWDGMKPLICRYDTRVDYVFCGQGVRTQWKATDAWHCPQTISDHNAVFVVFNRHSCSEDSSCCIEHQGQEDVGEDLWQNPPPGEGLEDKGGKKGKKKSRKSPERRTSKKAHERFKEGYHQLQKIEADIFSSAPVYLLCPVSQPNTPNPKFL